MTLQEWLGLNMGKYESTRIRLGQQFVIDTHIKHMPELFYETNEDVAIAKIKAWCEAMCYTDDLPLRGSNDC